MGPGLVKVRMGGDGCYHSGFTSLSRQGERIRTHLLAKNQVGGMYWWIEILLDDQIQ